MHVYIYIHKIIYRLNIYIYMCVCVFVNMFFIYIYYIYMLIPWFQSSIPSWGAFYGPNEVLHRDFPGAAAGGEHLPGASGFILGEVAEFCGFHGKKSGKHIKNYGKIHHVSENLLFLW